MNVGPEHIEFAKENGICEYVKDNKGRKVGYLVAFTATDKDTRDDRLLFGFSSWNHKMDKYDSTVAKKVAIGRAFEMNPDDDLPWDIMTYRVSKALPKFVNRAMTYFKQIEYTDQVPKWVNFWHSNLSDEKHRVNV